MDLFYQSHDWLIGLFGLGRYRWSIKLPIIRIRYEEGVTECDLFAPLAGVLLKGKRCFLLLEVGEHVIEHFGFFGDFSISA
jgi:hypothetical protein